MIKKFFSKVKSKSSKKFSHDNSRSLEKYVDKNNNIHNEEKIVAKKETININKKKHFSVNELKTTETNTWCPGCGNYAILAALKSALTEINVPLKDICIVYGIGCHGHTCNYINTYSFEGLHGRPIPVAEGIKLANNKLKVIIIAGDGDTYGEGLNHFISGVRGNHDVTLLVHNNRVYGLTTGQTSPTSDKGYKSKSTPKGVIELPVNPMALAISAGGGFVARGFSGNVKHLSNLIVKAIKHDGFSVIDIFQNCMSFNKVNTIKWFQDRVYDLGETSYKPNDRIKALEKAFEMGDKIPIGILYQDERESYTDALDELKVKPLLEHATVGMDLTEVFEKNV